MLLINGANGEIITTEDPSAYFAMGYREATPEELEHSARVEEFGGFEQQAQAQLERVTRGATLGLVEGFGDDPEAIRARADVSRELSPVTSFVADVAPDVGVAALTGGIGALATGAGRLAARTALAEGAGLVRAGLAAGRAGGAAALAAESVGTGLVGAGQSAYADDRSFADDPGKAAEDVLIFGGLNFGLGSFMMRGSKAAVELADDGADLAAKELDDVAAAAEVRAAKELPEQSIEGTPGQIYDVEGPGDTVELPRRSAGEAPFVPLETQLDEGLAAADPSRARAIIDRMRARDAQAGAVAVGPSAARAPLDDVEMIDADGMLDRVEPDDPRLAAIAPELDRLRAEGIAGMSLKDLHALPLDEGPGAAQSAAKVAAFETDETFLREGMLSSNNDRSRGGLPAISLFPGEAPELLNGRHRLAAARKVGRAEITMNVKAYDADGNPLWDYVGPVRVSPPRAGNIGARAGERGAVFLDDSPKRGHGAESGAVNLAGMATSPMGNVIAAGAGAAIGGAIGGDTESLAAGGALGFAASALAGRFGRRAMAAAVRQGEREAVDGGVERALRNASKSDAADVVERAIGADPVREADSFGRQRRLYINRDAIREVAAREMGQDLTKLVEDVRQVASVEKQAAIAQHVVDNLPAQRAVAKGVAEQAAKFAGELKAEARAYGAAAGKKGLQYAIPGQRDLSLTLMDHAKQVAQAPNGKALFEALDNFKRAAQEHKLSLEKGMLNSESAIHYEKLIPRVETFANSVRSALEDSTTWGRAGDMQRAYNAVIADKLIPHMRVFESAVLKKTHQGYDGLWKTEGWESKIKALLKDSDPGNRRHVLAVLDGMDELAAVQRQFGGAKEADKLSAQVAKVRRTIGLGDELADAEERMHALGQIIGGGPMGGFLAGGLAGGVPGAVIGAAVPGAVRGLVMGDLIQAFQRLSGATDAAVSRGVDDWIRSSRVRGGGLREKLPKLPRLSDEAKQLRDVAARSGITQSMALFMGEDRTPTAAYERLTTKLLDTEAFYDDLAEEYGTLQQEAPDVFMMIAARASVARQFLIDRMPPNVAVSAKNPKGYPPSREAIEDWATYVNAVRHPTRVMGNIGALRVQEVETLRTVHPRAHELLQQRVIEGLARSQELGEQLEDSALARVGILFPDLDGYSSPVFSREMGQVIIDKSRADREGSGAGGKSSGPLARKMTSPSQGLAQNGATFGVGP